MNEYQLLNMGINTYGTVTQNVHVREHYMNMYKNDDDRNGVLAFDTLSVHVYCDAYGEWITFSCSHPIVFLLEHQILR